MEYAHHLAEQGYAFIPGSYYKSLPDINYTRQEQFLADLENMKLAYYGLALDPYSPGRRFRAYAQCRRDEHQRLCFGHFTPYLQTAKYNPDTGGIIRSYPMLSDALINNPILHTLLHDDIRFIESYQKVGSPDALTIGIHFFRYQATPDMPAYSSPVWLHKDDEDVVFVHLIDHSPNMLGGDSLIAGNPKCIERVLKLESLFDTLVVNHDKYHAVTPVGCRQEGESDVSTRDIILVTFQRREAA